MKRLLLILAITISFVLSSCATIISGKQQYITFTSIPSAAAVYIDTVEVGKTPLEILLDRDKEYNIMLKHDGFRAHETIIIKSQNPWVYGNIIFGGIIGLLVDSGSGAAYELTPETTNAELIKESE